MKNEVKICFLGDICPINRVEKLILDNNFENFNEIRETLLLQDLVIANLECPLTNSTKKINKIGPNLKGHPKSIELLKFLNIKLVTLANNHILDYDQEGLIETQILLKNNGIDFVGAGINITDAQKPIIKEINGLKIGIINVCEREFSIAEEYYAGANPNEIIDTIKIIEEIKKKVDFLILIYHGGVEYYNLPTPFMQKILRYYSSIGVDLIIGHHSHIISGFEYFQKTPIFYSLGNFIFDCKNKPDFWYNNIMVNVLFKKDSSITFDIIPLNQCEEIAGVSHMELDAKLKTLSYITEISLTIKEESLVNKKWKYYCANKSRNIFANIFSINNNHRRLMARRLFPNLLLTGKKKRTLFNQFFCESHREMVFEILKSRKL